MQIRKKEFLDRPLHRTICTIDASVLHVTAIQFRIRKQLGEDNSMVPKLVVEFIGTFFLVFTVGMTVKGRTVPAPWPRWRSDRR